jgi:hypothetical protein
LFNEDRRVFVVIAFTEQLCTFYTNDSITVTNAEWESKKDALLDDLLFPYNEHTALFSEQGSSCTALLTSAGTCMQAGETAC